MAKFKFSPLVEQARGKFGNAVFSANGSGAYLRKLVQPRNPNTGLQATVRGRFGSIARRWRELTDATRQAWNEYSRQFSQSDIMGQNVKLSGFQLFTKLNNSLEQIGLAGLDTPAGNPAFHAVAVQVEGEGNEAYFNGYDADAFYDNDAIAVVWYTTPVMSVGRQTVSNSEYRVALVMATPEFRQWPLGLDKLGINTNLPAGQQGKVFVKVEQVHKATGWRSPAETYALQIGA